MRKTTIVLVAVVIALAMAATPVVAEDANAGEEYAGPCVAVSIDPVGVSVDPRCLEDRLPAVLFAAFGL